MPDLFQTIQANASRPEQTTYADKTIEIQARYLPDSERYPTYFVGMDNEDLYGQYQGTLEKWGNGTVKALSTVGTTFLSGTVGLVNGVYQAVSTGKSSSFYDNEFQASLDDWTQTLNNQFAHYQTNAERDAAWYSPSTWGSANFWSDTILNGLGFAGGAFLSGAAWSKAFGAIGQLSKVLSKGTPIEEVNALRTSAREAGLLTRNTNEFAALGDDLGTLANRATQTQLRNTTTKAYGDNLLRSVTAASGEAQIEAYHAKNDYKDQLISEFEQTNGYPPSDKDLEEIDEVATSIGNSTFASNMALLTLSNLYQFPKIMGKSYSTDAAGVLAAGERRVGRQVVLDAEGKVIKREGIFGSKVTADVAKGERYAAGNMTWAGDQLARTKFGKTLNKVAPWTRLAFSPNEAFEEGTQSFLPTYFTNLYDKDSDTQGDITSSFKKSLGETLESKEFWTSVVSGGIVGAIMENSRPSTFNQAVRTRNSTRKKVTDMSNSLNNTPFSNYTEVFAESVDRNERIEEQATNAIINGDRLGYEDSKTDQMLNYIIPRVQYGREDLMQQDLQSWKEVMQDPDSFNELKRSGAVDENTTQEQFLQGIDRMQTMTQAITAQFNNLNLRYANSVKQDGTFTHPKEVLMKMAYTAGKINDYNGRIGALSRSLTERQIPISDILNLFTQPGEYTTSSAETVTKAARLERQLEQERNKETQDLNKIFALEDELLNIPAAVGGTSFGGQVATTSLDQYAEEVANLLETRPLTSDEKTEIFTQIGDLMELTARRKYRLDEYDAMVEHGEAFKNAPAQPVLEEEQPEDEIIPTNSTLKEQVYEDNKNVPFIIDFGNKGQEEGLLTYDAKQDILAVTLPDGTLYEVTSQDFNNGIVQRKDGQAVTQEFLEDSTDPRIEVKRQNIIAAINTNLQKKKDQLKILEDEYQSKAEDLKNVGEGLQTAISTTNSKSVIDTLTTTHDIIQKELDQIQRTKFDLEEQIATYADILANRPDDYAMVLRDIENYISQTNTFVNTLTQRESFLKGLLQDIEAAIKGFAKLIKDKTALKLARDPQNLGWKLIHNVSHQLTSAPLTPNNSARDEYVRLSEALDSYEGNLNISEAQKNKVQNDLTSVQTSLEEAKNTLNSQNTVYQELLDTSFTIQSNVQPENFMPKAEVQMEGLESTEDEGAPQPPYEGAKKILANLFRSTKAMNDQNQKLTWYKRYLTATQTISKLPTAERKKIKTLLITANNENVNGLRGLIDSVYTNNFGKPYFTSLEQKLNSVDGGIFATLIREEENGKQYFINEKGENLGEVGTEIPIGQIVGSKLSEASLLDTRKGQAYVKPETVSVTPEELVAEYTALRTEILANTSLGKSYSFRLSAGNRINSNESSAVGVVVNEQDINKPNILLKIKSGMTYFTKTGEQINPGKGSAFILENEDGAIPLYVAPHTTSQARNLAKITELIGKSSTSIDNDAVNFLTNSLPSNISLKDNKLLVNKSSKLFKNSKELFETESTTTTAVLADLDIFRLGTEPQQKELRDKIIKALSDQRPLINETTFQEGFTEVLVEDNGSLTKNNFTTYQGYLLQKVLKTDLKGATNKYMIINDFLNLSSQVQPDQITTEDLEVATETSIFAELAIEEIPLAETTSSDEALLTTILETETLTELTDC